MFRQFSTVLAATALISGCALMQSSEELVRSSTPWPHSPIPMNDVASEDDMSTPAFLMDDAKNTDAFFDLLENPADDNNAANAGMANSDDNVPAVSAMEKNDDKSSADNASDQSSDDIIMSGNTVFFEFGSKELGEKGQVLLDNFVEQLGSSESVEVTGYTCNLGPEEFNQYLSESRAQAVKAYLVLKGVAEDRIVTKAEGIENPAASNDEKETRMKNRRVEVKVLP